MTMLRKLGGLAALLLASSLNAQVMDKSFYPEHQPRPLTSIVNQADAETTARRRPVRRPAEDDLPRYLLPVAEELRVIIANPTDTPIIATFEGKGSTVIPPGQLYVNENICDNINCGTYTFLKTKGVVVVKNTAIISEPAGVGGHMVNVQLNQNRIDNVIGAFFLPFESERKTDLLLIAPTESEDHNGSIRYGAKGIMKPAGAVPANSQRIITNWATDDQNGSLTGAPNAIITRGAGLFWSEYNNLFGQAIFYNTRNNDTYSGPFNATREPWVIMLGIGRETPVPTPKNGAPSIASGRTAIIYINPTSIDKKSITATAIGTDGSASVTSFEQYAFISNSTIPLYVGGHYSFQYVVDSGDAALIAAGYNNIADSKGIFATEQVPSLTQKDLLVPGSKGVAAGIGENSGAYTTIDMFVPTFGEKSDYTLVIRDDLNRELTSVDYTLNPGQYKRVNLKDIITAELIYGTAYIVPKSGGVVASFGRTDKGGGDSLTGKFVKYDMPLPPKQ